jgi:hypothetical protein
VVFPCSNIKGGRKALYLVWATLGRIKEGKEMGLHIEIVNLFVSMHEISLSWDS